MKPGFLSAIALTAALCCAPALAQHSASGRISGAMASAPSASEPAAVASTPAPASGGDGASATTAASPPAATPATPAMAAPRAPVPAQTVQLAPPAAPSSVGLLQTTLALGFVLAVLVGAAWLLKRYGPKSITGGAAVRLIGALNVGARERILVVEVGEQWIVVGASPGRMNALATMPRQEAEDSLAPPPSLPSANFAEWFKQTIEKRNGK